MAKPPHTSRLASALLKAAPAAAVAWAAFWGLVTYNVFAEGSGPGVVLGGIFTVLAGLLPGLMMVMKRRDRARSIAPSTNYAKVPGYRRLIKAYDQAEGLVAAGIIDAKVLRGVPDRIDELMRLVSADISNEKLGGRPSPQLRSQVDQLTSLIVGLTDAALDRRTAALDGHDEAAAALREALAQIRAETQGYQELKELEDN
jgi:hypothetical protein